VTDILSTFGPPKVAGAFASVADIFILPVYDPVPL